MTVRRIKVEPLMADFMAATTGLEKYLKQGGPLRPLQFESMCLAVSMLRTFLNTWKVRYGGGIHLSKKRERDLWFIHEENYQALPVHGDRAKRHSAAVVLGRVGGLKGGKARASTLSPKRRIAIAKAAATARWAKRSQ